MDRFTAFLEEQSELFHRQEQELQAANCKDEANFVKIKSNTCGICKTFYQVACKKEEEAAIYTEYIRLLDKLIAEWKQSYEKAKEFDDVKKIVVEEAKLEVIETVKQKLEEIRGTQND